MNKQPSLESAMAKAKQPEPVPEEEIPNRMATRKRRGKHGYTVYVDPIVREAIKRVAKKRSQTIEEVFLAGLNYILISEGESGIA